MRSLISIVGFLAGVAAGLTFLLTNPLQSPQMNVTPADNVYNWRPLEFHGAIFGANRLMNIPLNQRNEGFLADGIETANAALLILSDSNGRPAALATRIVVQDDNSDLLRSRVGVATYTNIIWPNYGSLFLHGEENRWPIIRNDALKLLGEGNYKEQSVFNVSPVDGEQLVAGGSGGFSGVGGRFSEQLTADPANPARFAGRVGLELETGG